MHSHDPGPVRVFAWPAPVWPGPKRTGPNPWSHPRPRQARAGRGGVRAWTWFPPKSVRKLQILKGHTLYSNLFIFKPSTFHIISNHIQRGIKIFWLLLLLFSFWIMPISILNIPFIQKWNWTYEYNMFIPTRRRTHFNHHVILSIDHASIQLKNSLKILCFPTGT